MINRNTDKNNEVLLNVRHLIGLAITQQESTHLKEAIDAIDHQLEDNALIERIKLELLFECFVVSISKFSLCDLSDEQAAWKRYTHTDLTLSWDTGLDYIIDRFLKRHMDTNQHTDIINAHNAIITTFDFLNCASLKNQRDAVELFYKKISIYKNIALNALRGNKQPPQEEQISTNRRLIQIDKPITASKEHEWQAVRIDLTNLENLNKMRPDALKKIQQATLVMLDKRFSEKDGKNNSNSALFTMATLLTASVICHLHEKLEDGVINSEYKRYLCSTYKSSVLHQLRKNGPTTTVKERDYYALAIKNVISIFLYAFPMANVNETGHILKLIKNGIVNVTNANNNNAPLLKICKLIIHEFDKFKQRHAKFYPYFTQVNDRYGETDIDVPEMKEINHELKRLVQNIIPEQCMNILSYFHDKIAITNLLLLNDDKKNSKTHKKQAIDSFKRAINCWPSRTLDINVLYCADISLYEIDDELMNIVKNLKKTIKEIKSKSVKLNIEKFNLSFFNDIQRYLKKVTSYQTRSTPTILKYNESLSLSHNLSESIDSYFSWLMQSNEYLAILCCCQALEQIIEDCLVESNMTDVQQSILPIIMRAKLQTIATLMKESKLANNAESSHENIIRKFGQQYILAATKLNQDDSRKIIDNNLITDSIIYLVDINERQGNSNVADEYLNTGINLSPDNISLLNLKISIEQDRITECIEKTYNDKLNADSIRISLMDIDHSIAALTQPSKIDLPDDIKSLKNDYEKFALDYTNLINQFSRINKYRESINTIQEKYNLIAEILDQSIVFSDSRSMTKEINSIYKKLDRLQEIKKSISNEVALRQAYLTTYQSLAQCITLYKANIEIYRLQEQLINKKIIEHHAKSALKEAILDLKRAKIQLKKEKINQTRLQEEYHTAKKHEVEINLQTKKLLKTEEESQADLNASLAKEEEASRNLEMTMNLLENTQAEENTQHAQLGYTKSEENHPTNNDLLNGSGMPVSLAALNIIKNLDLSLRKIGAKIIFKSSLTTRFCISYFNDNQEVAKNFPVHDIDIFIPYNCNIDTGEVLRTIEQFGFHQNLNTKTHNTRPYRQFNNKIDGTNIDITLATQISYSSFEFIILRMGKMEFAYFDNETEYQDAVASGRLLMPAENHVFEITLPKGYEDKFISACKFDEFVILKPDNLYKSYCYSIYKYSTKLHDCGVLDQVVANHHKTSEYIQYHELYAHLINHFNQQLQFAYSTVYLEMNEFIKKGVDTRVKHLAIPFISAFYYSLIKYKTSQINGLNIEIKLDFLADQCSNIFINKHIIHNKSPKIELYDLIDVINAIADDEIHNYSLSPTHSFFLNNSNTYSGTFFNTRTNMIKNKNVESDLLNRVTTQNK